MYGSSKQVNHTAHLCSILHTKRDGVDNFQLVAMYLWCGVLCLKTTLDKISLSPRTQPACCYSVIPGHVKQTLFRCGKQTLLCCGKQTSILL